MTPEARMLIGLLLAAVLAYAATPVAIRVAGHLEFFYEPAGYKGHAATPYLGGAAAMAAFVVTLLVLAGDYGRTLPLVVGVAMLWRSGRWTTVGTSRRACGCWPSSLLLRGYGR